VTNSTPHAPVVIAASGMCEHGRILHHLKHGIEDARNYIVFVGYLGRTHPRAAAILENKKPSASSAMNFAQREVHVANAFSAHATATT
jgi:metallo-beta-lactamase family protein